MNVAGGGTEIGSAAHIGSEGGEWITPAVSYVDPRRRFCVFCGRPIARRFWQAGAVGGAGIYCDPAHAQRHATYPLSSTCRSEDFGGD